MRSRSRFPTSRQWPDASPDRQPIRRHLYDTIKAGPITAAFASSQTGLSLPAAIDELRIMESWLLVRHVVDDLGVVRWQWTPDNYWEADPVPF